MSTERDDDAGYVGGMEGLVFGVLVFVLGLLVVSNAWGVVDAKLTADAAAREATRAFVESRATTADAAFAEARRAAEDVIVAHGRSLDRFDLDAAPGLELRRCAPVELRAHYRVPLVARFGSGIEVIGRHTEIVDPYRSGVPGDSSCP